MARTAAPSAPHNLLDGPIAPALLRLAVPIVLANVLQLVMIPAMGLSMAISTLVGQNIDAGLTERAAHAARLGARMGFAGMTAFGLVVLAFAPQFATFFVPQDHAVIDEAARFLRTMAPAWGFLACNCASRVCSGPPGIWSSRCC
ncbi:MATE family efflux transporter [Flaviaesturariibacter aridisoli]|uniref:MATE family efflux transporter n=1 Tax=Flaviaesturariibacter aridisoli TaxID=2545761 RepID=A0A4R4E4F9_9BACT|nr:MATE family efflux transporter [Flaviaesturariibacter aridisoli]TCZ73733.1 hypothetical protein E0486_05470 [Flaviaesturariibacter aridisoli]